MVGAVGGLREMQHEVELRFSGLQRSRIAAGERSRCLRGKKSRGRGNRRKGHQDVTECKEAQRELRQSLDSFTGLDVKAEEKAASVARGENQKATRPEKTGARREPMHQATGRK